MRYGRTGADGVRSEKSFGSVAEATKFLDKTVAEKLKKGYKNSGSGPASAVAAPKASTSAASKKRDISKVEPSKDEDDDEDEDVTASDGDIKYLTCVEGNSDKFYELITNGSDVTIRYGRTGSAGISSVKSFKSQAEAVKFVNKTVAEKTKKGYCLRATCKCAEGCVFTHGHRLNGAKH